ncbi:MAG: DUF4912 domain-containing protein [Myxococcales bacterium]|nr:DUF4912 domain-containing protein [Myxococcales bacterium]
MPDNMERELEDLTVEELRLRATALGVLATAGMGREALLAALAQPVPSPPAASSSIVPVRPVEADTETMARLYLQQGRPERAAEIYRKLLAIEPQDAALRERLVLAEDAILADAAREADQARGGRAAPPPGIHPPPPARAQEPHGMLDLEELPDGYGVDECELIVRDPYHLFAYWEVTDGGLGDARRHLGDEAGDAKLVLRMFVTHPGERGTTRDTRDHALDQRRGRRYLPAPKPGLQVRAAIGLVARSGLFAPIAHSGAVRIPPAEPAPTTVPVWIEVPAASSAGGDAEPIRVLRGEEVRAHSERGLPAAGRPAPSALPALPGRDASDASEPEEGPGRPTSPWRRRPGSSS